MAIAGPLFLVTHTRIALQAGAPIHQIFLLTTYRLVCIIRIVMATNTAVKAPEATRHKILMAAFAEFYKNGFQGGSLNHIVETAGTTKGALFHHFAGKQELGYAVVDEIIRPIAAQRWLDPMVDSTNPIADLKRAFRQHVKEDIDSGHFVQ